MYSAKTRPTTADAIIIGGGASGLATATTLAKQGKRVVVLEQHDRPGGGLHTFEDHGYEWDTGFHYAGEAAGSDWPLNRIMKYFTTAHQEWAAMGDCPVCPGETDHVFFQPDLSKDVPAEDQLVFGADHAEMKKYLQQRFPRESKGIEKYYKFCADTGALVIPYYLYLSLPKWLQPWLRPILASKLLHVATTTTTQSVSKFVTDQKLEAFLTYLWGCFGVTPDESSALINGCIFQHYSCGACYPIGGPMALALGMCRNIHTVNNSQVLIKAQVEKILLSEDRKSVVGVQMEKDGHVITSNYVISTVGLHRTYLRLLPEVNETAKVRRSIKKLQNTRGHMYLFCGLDATCDELDVPRKNHWIFPTHEYSNIDNSVPKQFPFGSEDCPFYYMAYAFSSTKDPQFNQRHPGKTTLIAISEVPNSWFEEYRDTKPKQRGEAVEAIKKQYADMCIKLITARYPQIQDKIDFYEVGTPLCNDYYLNAWDMRSYGLQVTPARYSKEFEWVQPQTKLQGLLLAGQDMYSDGFVPSLMSGVSAASVVAGFFNVWLAVLWAIGPIVMFKFAVFGPPKGKQENKCKRA